MLGDGFGEDEIEPGGVEASEFGEESSSGFAEVAGGAEDFDGGKYRLGVLPREETNVTRASSL